MHVLIVPSWYFKKDSPDIGGRMFHQLAASLRKHDIDARIFFGSLKLTEPIKKHGSFSMEEDVPTWRVRQWHLPKVSKFLIHAWQKKYCECILEYISKEGKPDVIHAQSYPAGIVAAMLKQKTGIPYIITERLSSFIRGEIKSKFAASITNSFEEASRITCVSPDLKLRLQKYTSKQVDVIPNFFDPSVFYYDPSVQKNELFTWVSIGEPAQVKGLDILIEAYGMLRKNLSSPSMQLVLADELREKNKLLALASKWNIEKEIKWTGLIPQMEVAGLLRRSHVLISSSRIETFGKAMMESQACGLPVIASTTDGARYILESGIQGKLIPTGDAAALAKAMAEMFSSYHRYNGTNISNLAIKRFHEEVVIEQWKSLYTETAKC